jgi:hypothetical protein
MWSVTNSSKILVTRKASFVTTIHIRWMQLRKMMIVVHERPLVSEKESRVIASHGMVVIT